MHQIIVLDTNLLYDYLDIKLENKCKTKDLKVAEFIKFIESKEVMKGFHVASLYELFGRMYNQAYDYYDGDLKKVYYSTKKKFTYARRILETKEYNIKFLNDNYFINEMNSKLDAEQYCVQNMEKKKSFEIKELTRVMFFLMGHYSFHYLDKNDEIVLQNFHQFIGMIEKNLLQGITEVINGFYSEEISKTEIPKKLSYIIGAQINFVDYVFNEQLVYHNKELRNNLRKIREYRFKSDVDGIQKIQVTLGKGVPKVAADKKVNIFFRELKSEALKNGRGFNELEMSYFQYLFQSIQSTGRKIDKNDAIDFVISTSFEPSTIKRKVYGYLTNYNATFVTNDKFLREFIKKREMYNKNIHSLIFN
ncbi:hypothetical protein [Viridibacillus arvi]|uniref:hypothetical protein n=1 Tax=Viridibacillus arvi TaxID=263475 RepID=UPI003D2833D9